MNLTRIKSKTIVFSLVVAVLTLTVTNLNAQNDGNGGLFGWGKATEKEMYNYRGVMNRGGDSESFFCYNL